MKQIVICSGGNIVVESEGPGKGSLFAFSMGMIPIRQRNEKPWAGNFANFDANDGLSSSESLHASRPPSQLSPDDPRRKHKVSQQLLKSLKSLKSSLDEADADLSRKDSMKDLESMFTVNRALQN